MPGFTGQRQSDALDAKLYTETNPSLKELLKGMLYKSASDRRAISSTFMQLYPICKAQPMTYPSGAYVEIFQKGTTPPLTDIYERMNYCPLGFPGSLGQPIHWTENGCRCWTLMTLNSMDSVSRPGLYRELTSTLSTVHGTFPEPVPVKKMRYNQNSMNTGLLSIDDSPSTGSSALCRRRKTRISELLHGRLAVSAAIPIPSSDYEGIPAGL